MAMQLWLFNPFTFTISTRGNCDTITVLGILLLIKAIENGRYLTAGLLWGLCVHWRLFPVIYAPSLLSCLTHRSAQRRGSESQVCFTICAFCTEGSLISMAV